MASFTVAYIQDDNTNSPGKVLLSEGGAPPESRDASGRLDNIGDFVSADFRGLGGGIMVECIRTSKNRMQIRIFSISFSGGYEGSYSDEFLADWEKVLDDVPITFD